MENKTFAPGKIILSGEYAVVFGYTGIAFPLPIGMTAEFKSSGKPGDINITWQGIPATHGWPDYLKQVIALCQKSLGQRQGGDLIINNHLPLGKGLGSSTTLVVAVCRAFLGSDCKAQALAIEDEVNPGHSGIDFAVIWNNHPVQFNQTSGTQQVELTDSFLENALLIDTGTPDQSTPELVAWMKERAQEPAVAQVLSKIDECSLKILAGESPLQIIKTHHLSQIELGVVPNSHQELITKIEQLKGAGKTLGAGSRTGHGGMVLAILPDKKAKESLVKQISYDTIEV